jgi:histone-lysine N-methyltransferase SETD1
MHRRHSNDRPPPPNGPMHRGGPDRSANGPHPPHHAPLSHPPPPKFACYKLIIDPFIHKDVKEKVVRYDGEIPGDLHSITPTPVDPRKRPISLWKLERTEVLDLPVPRFTIDDNYTGDPPKVEVTLDNLNDNVDKQFLAKTLHKFGETESIEIEYHPITSKHLGLARAVFLTVKGARLCVSALHGRTMMGKEVNCYLDPRGKACAKLFEQLTRVKEPTPPPPEPRHEEPPPVPEEEAWDPDWSREKSWRDGGRDEESWRDERDDKSWRDGREEKS